MGRRQRDSETANLMSILDEYTLFGEAVVPSYHPEMSLLKLAVSNIVFMLVTLETSLEGTSSRNDYFECP